MILPYDSDFTRVSIKISHKPIPTILTHQTIKQTKTTFRYDKTKPSPLNPKLRSPKIYNYRRWSTFKFQGRSLVLFCSLCACFMDGSLTAPQLCWSKSGVGTGESTYWRNESIRARELSRNIVTVFLFSLPCLMDVMNSRKDDWGWVLSLRCLLVATIVCIGCLNKILDVCLIISIFCYGIRLNVLFINIFNFDFNQTLN